MSIKEIKRQAKTTLANLSGKYLLFLIPTILTIFHFGIEVHQGYVMATGIKMSLRANYFPLLIALIITLFTLSAAFTMIDVVRHYRREVTFNETTTAFSGEYFGKLVVLFIMKRLFFLVWSLIWFLGLFIFILGLSAFLMNAKSGTGVAISVIFLVFGAILALVGFGIYLNRYYAYSLAEYILYDKVKEGTYLGTVDIIEISVAMIKGYKWKLFLLQLSFIGWFLLNILTLGLLNIYLLPYFTTANVIFYNQLKQRFDESDEPFEGEHLRIPKLSNHQTKPVMCDDSHD
ncbi:DUF975 family protein [Streptococcus dysgalactiae]|uniref:Integral membrane protein n=1 Tax=Streptococcus dysgalactiae TaxID=1334 RepID=A0A9X9SHZ7_STRDY|nr:DUF975 family protein [Streptococcus dysgalactiae]VTS48227.1 integral membrane protein [Streptococcus dysgalactiae subsp. equisimilis]VTS50602.1 integral membrane protein [Streptococcus dysgalactiae subsp. equisimilis]VTS78517.1 integral membrane protein [Streptococcus dysgalactiae]